jgi:hypothetical protein
MDLRHTDELKDGVAQDGSHGMLSWYLVQRQSICRAACLSHVRDTEQVWMIRRGWMSLYDVLNKDDNYNNNNG